MSETRIAFVWTLRYEDPLMASEVLERVRAGIATWMMLYPEIYSQGWTTGTVFGGLIQVGIVVRRRDQWACRRESRRFATALALRAKVSMSEVVDPIPSSLPPHEHRGRRRFEAPKYLQEAPDGS